MPKVILSTNDHPDYLFFTPITAWMWKQYGFDTILLMPEKKYDNTLLNHVLKTSMGLVDTTVFVEVPEGYREDTVTQASRIFASALTFHPEDYLITGDIDMLPLCDMFIQDYHAFRDNINLYGHDLTGYGHYPICYIAAKVKYWREFMELEQGNINGQIKAELDKWPKAKSDKWEDYWSTDQDIVTSKINFHKQIKPELYRMINRGHQPNSVLPFGRVDRYDWEGSMKFERKIDAHLLRPGHEYMNFQKTLDLIKQIFPYENFDWMIEYKNKYISLI